MDMFYQVGRWRIPEGDAVVFGVGDHRRGEMWVGDRVEELYKNPGKTLARWGTENDRKKILDAHLARTEVQKIQGDLDVDGVVRFCFYDESGEELRSVVRELTAREVADPKSALAEFREPGARDGYLVAEVRPYQDEHLDPDEVNISAPVTLIDWGWEDDPIRTTRVSF